MLRKSVFSSLIFSLYKVSRLRGLCVRLADRLEGADMYSATMRRILKEFHGVEVGAYSYGDCLRPGVFPPNVSVGRYVSVASGVRIYRRNHPVERLSMHALFYNSALGLLPKDSISGHMPLEIGHDSWIGGGTVITPRCSRIGIGAVVGAGSVVTSDIPDFAIAVGNPARILRYRFPEEMRHRILQSRWWERPIEECVPFMEYMTRPVTEEHPFLSNREPVQK